jgi:integrase
VSRGDPFKRCGCRDPETGKQLGSRCPQLRRKDGGWSSKHGNWAYFATVRGEDGRRTRVLRSGFESSEEAADDRLELRRRDRRGLVAHHRTMTGEYLVGWLEAKDDVKASTRHGYAQHLTRHLIPALGDVPLVELRTAHVAGALRTVTSSDANRQRVRATLRAALADAVREGLLERNPAALVRIRAGKRPKALVWTPERIALWRTTGVKPSPVMVWTAEQTGIFLDATADDRLAALWHLAAYRGLRRGELCGLGWSDVDLVAGHLTVRRSRVQVGWSVVEDAPKSDAGERTVALDVDTVTVLREHAGRQALEREQWGAAWRGSGYVFTREDGSPVHPEYVTSRFATLAAAAGLPPVQLHGLRHGAASLMLAAGVPMKVVSETLGHSTVKITSDTYTSVFPDVSISAAELTARSVPRSRRVGVITNASPATADSAADGLTSGAGGDRTHAVRIMSRSGNVPHDAG